MQYSWQSKKTGNVYEISVEKSAKLLALSVRLDAAKRGKLWRRIEGHIKRMDAKTTYKNAFINL